MKKSHGRPVPEKMYQEQITIWCGPEFKKAVEARGRAREFRSTSDYGRFLFREDLPKK